MIPEAETLAAAMPHVLAAPKDTGPATMLCTRPAVGERLFVNRLRLTAAEGIPGDRWLNRPWLRLPDGRPDPDIQVSILPARVLSLVWHAGDDVPHPGDPIVADLDMSTTNLPPGTHLRAGTATLRVSPLFNDACAKWRARYGDAAKDWITAPGHPVLRLRGILCAVVEDGEISLGDRLTRLP